MNSNALGQEFDRLYSKISEVRDIVLAWPATYQRGLKMTVGFLFLTDGAIEYYSQKIAFLSQQNIAILLDDILKIKSYKDRLIIFAKNRRYRFFVSDAKKWEETIKKML